MQEKSETPETITMKQFENMTDKEYIAYLEAGGAGGWDDKKDTDNSSESSS